MTADEVLNALKEAHIIKSIRSQPIYPPSLHFRGCPVCGKYYADCVCFDNKIIKLIRELEKKEKK